MKGEEEEEEEEGACEGMPSERGVSEEFTAEYWLMSSEHKVL